MSTTDERRSFGAKLRQLRTDRDWSLDDLAAKLRENGEATSAANIGAWERGQYAPRNRSVLVALEQLLDARDDLAPLLGISLAGAARLDAIRDRLARNESDPVGVNGRWSDLTDEQRQAINSLIDTMAGDR